MRRPFARKPRPKRYSLIIRSAESTRMTGLRHIPVEERERMVRAFLNSAR